MNECTRRKSGRVFESGSSRQFGVSLLLFLQWRPYIWYVTRVCKGHHKNHTHIKSGRGFGLEELPMQIGDMLDKAPNWDQVGPRRKLRPLRTYHMTSFFGYRRHVKQVA